MKNIKRILLTSIVLAAITTSTLGCNSPQKTSIEIQNTVIAKVYDKEITASQIDKQLAEMYNVISSQVDGDIMENPEAKKTIVESREQAINAIIEKDIINQQILLQNITASPEEIDDIYNLEIDKFIANADNSKDIGIENFKKALKDSNYQNEEGFKSHIKEQLLGKKLITTIISTVPKPTDAELKSYYEENKEQYTKEAGAHVYQIVVDSKEKAEQLRDTYLKETKNITDVNEKLVIFNKLASTNNIDATKSVGGDLGYIKYDETNLVPTFMDALKKLKNDGDISSVVNSKTSTYSVYNFIFVAEVNQKKSLKSFDEVNNDKILETELYEQKQQQAFTTQLDEWKKSANSEILIDKLDYPVTTKNITK